MPNNSFLKIGATTGELASGTISDSLIWGDHQEYPRGGGHCISNNAVHGCRWEVDILDHSFINFGVIFSPVSLRFYSKSRDESSMVIDKDTGAVIIGKNVKVLTNADAQLEIHGDVHIIGSLYVNGVKIA